MLDAAIDTVLTGTADPPVSAPAAPGSFDGGARQSVPSPPPGYDEWLVTLVRQRLADRGAEF